METLFIYYNHIQNRWMLKDSTGFMLGWFNTSNEAADWCVENGYKFRVQK